MFEYTQMIIRTHIEISCVEKSLLIVLSDAIDDKGYCFPSQELLAARIETSIKSVQRAIKVLKQKGLIKVHRKKHHGVNYYWIDIDKINEIGVYKSSYNLNCNENAVLSLSGFE